MEKEKYNEYFRSYGAHVHYEPIRFEKIAKLCKGKVLDVACGTGTLASFYEGKYTGIDISDIAIKYAKEIRRQDAEFIEMDATDPRKTLGKQYDTIVLAEFIEHLEKDDILFHNIKKWLKLNGRIIISVPNSDRVPDPDHQREFTVPRLRKRFSQIGRVKFHNYEGFRERILLTIDIGKEEIKTAGLCMIVKNEKKGLETAILSCIDFADHIQISVDTKTTDQTEEIAKKYADTLKKHDWQENFAKARNQAQTGIPTEWVLHLDGHEYVEKYKPFKKHLKKEHDAVLIQEIRENQFTQWFPRLIRKKVSWTQPVHNHPQPENPTYTHALIYKHDRKNLQERESAEARAEQRDEMVFKIMGNKLKKNKKDTRSRFYLAQQYRYRQDLKNSIKHYKKYLKYSTNTQERWFTLYILGDLYNAQEKYGRALMHFSRAEREIPERWEIKKKIGATLLFIKKYKQAVEYLINALGQNKYEHIFNPETKNDAHTWFIISICFSGLNNPQKTKVALKRAKQLNEKSEEELLQEDQKRTVEHLLND